MSEGELRAMVREVLREALAARGVRGAPAARTVTPAAKAAGGNGPAPAERIVEPVRIGTEAELAAFVRRLAALLADPASAAAVREGRHRFTLAAAGAPAETPAPTGAVTLTGTVTEAKVARLPEGGTAVLARGAVMTPLARDRARAMRIRIERRR